MSISNPLRLTRNYSSTSRRCGELWTQSSEAEKKKYNDIFIKEKEMLYKEQGKPNTTIKKKKKSEKDYGESKRPKNSKKLETIDVSEGSD